MTLTTKSLCLAGALALASAAGGAFAQDNAMQSPPQKDTMGSMGHETMGHEKGHDMMHKKNGSMHAMSATVNSVDMNTGVVDVTADGMALKVHFPAASVKDLKSGDMITLHMGFSKK